MLEPQKVKVEFAHDDRNDHKADMAECTDSSIKEFDTVEEAQHFALECTYVYNLNEILGCKAIKHNGNPVLDSIQNNRSIYEKETV